MLFLNWPIAGGPVASLSEGQEHFSVWGLGDVTSASFSSFESSVGGKHRGERVNEKQNHKERNKENNNT